MDSYQDIVAVVAVAVVVAVVVEEAVELLQEQVKRRQWHHQLWEEEMESGIDYQQPVDIDRRNPEIIEIQQKIRIRWKRN